MWLILTIIGFVAYNNAKNLITTAGWVNQTHFVLERLEKVLTTLVDAETGQRGFLLTDEAQYLEPYNAGIQNIYQELDRLWQLTSDDPEQQRKIELMRPLIDEKLEELRHTIELHMNDRKDSALTVVRSGIGKRLMDSIRAAIMEMENEEYKLLEERNALAQESSDNSISIGFVMTFLAIAIVGVTGHVIANNIGSVFRLLEQERQALARSNRELDDFAYIASHDLKEPLRGINNYASFIAKDYSDKLGDEGKAKLDTIHWLAERLSNYIESLLQYSRIGRTELAYKEVDLQEVVEELVESLQASLAEKEIEMRIPQSLPTVYCDHVRVREIFYNLIVNAVKYNDKSNKWIEVGFDNANGDVVFYVRDNGIGIREKHLHKIFGIFKRLHGEEDQDYGDGTGAGLTIVKKIVERHNGKIWVESVHGEGTTFYFTLQKDNPDG